MQYFDFCLNYLLDRASGAELDLNFSQHLTETRRA